MLVTVETPNTRSTERDYVLKILLGDFLGLDWRRKPMERSDVRLTLAHQTGELRLPDTFFSTPAHCWLQKASMPTRPLATLDTRALAGDITLVDSKIPILFGDTTLETTHTGSTITLPVDLFGSAFFMLSRYEEMVTPDRDEHGRFPSWASTAYQEDFLDRPIVDEYTEILWSAMMQLWPGLERKQHQFRTLVTCDVDSALSFRGNLIKLFRRLGGDLLKRRSPKMAVRSMITGIRVGLGNLDADPHWSGLRWIMEVNEKAGNSVAFYFIPEITDINKDNSLSLDDPRMQTMLREMHNRGHEIGFHPGYNTFRHSEAMAKSCNRLQYVMHENGIKQLALGGRQHFLRWETPTTPQLWEENNFDYDSTLAYADRPGFRCGTCREYTLYDLANRKPLKLKERPLIIMECSVIADRYLGMGYSNDALEYFTYYRDICRKFKGDFTLLWHNSHLNHKQDKYFYQSLIGMAP